MFKSKAASPQSSFDCHVFKAKLSAPHSKTLSLYIMSYHLIVSFVVSLFESIGPSNVARNIAFGIINSFYGVVVARWMRNFFAECCKINPRLMDVYSSASIIRIRMTRWPSASLNYIVMSSIKFRRANLFFMTMFVIHSNGLSVGCKGVN